MTEFYDRVADLAAFLVDQGNRLKILAAQRKGVSEVLEKTESQFKSGEMSEKSLERTADRLNSEMQDLESEMKEIVEHVIEKLLEATE